MLFDGMERSKYKRVSRQAQYLSDFEMTDGQWENLLIPINMAFFMNFSSRSIERIHGSHCSGA